MNWIRWLRYVYLIYSFQNFFYVAKCSLFKNFLRKFANFNFGEEIVEKWISEIALDSDQIMAFNGAFFNRGGHRGGHRGGYRGNNYNPNFHQQNAQNSCSIEDFDHNNTMDVDNPPEFVDCNR